MDYDDNDAKEQNLHLAGEGSSKVSPILQPYALPKFDFDDSLQGHLRFDSLVENEVFLGITSQEDNQWIEEYSRGTSAIQFSSSAVESRRKNVWSEATSSESVEMLLKSVGQEERVVEETTIEETVACDKSGSLTNVMDPILKQCDGTDDYVNTYDAPVPDEFQENFVGSKASSYCEQSHAASTPQSQETPISGGKLDSVVIGNKCSLSVGEKKVDKICDDVNQEPVNVANESYVKDSQEDPSVSKIECENAGSSVNVNASVEECQENPQEVPKRCIENVSGLSKNNYNSEPEHTNKSKENIMDNPTNSGTIVETCTYSIEKLSVVSNVGSLENPLVEGSIPVDDKPTCSSPIGSCDMQITEGCNAHVCSAEHSLGRKSEISASLICSKIDQELNDNIHVESLATSPNGGCVKRQAIEDADTQSDIPGSPKSNVGSLSSLSHVQNHSFGETENGVVSDGQQVSSGASMVSLGNNRFELSEGSDINNVGKTSIAAGSSAEMPAEDISIKDEAAGHAPDVHTGDSNDEYRSLPAKISSLVQVGDEIQSSEPDAISMDQDVTFNERGDARLPLDFKDADMHVVGALDSQKNVEPSSSAEGCKGVMTLIQGSEPNMTVLTDAVAAVEPSKISPPDTPDDVHLPSETDATADIVTGDQPISPILGVNLLEDGNEEKTVGFFSEESSQKKTQEVDNMVDCAVDGQLPVFEEDAVSDDAEKVVHKLDGDCDPPVGNCNASPSEQIAEDNPGDLKCSKTLETIPLPCESSAEGGNDAEAGGLLTPRESIAGDGVEPQNLAVNMSDEQQASVDVAGPSERDANHVVQNGVGSTLLDKPQIFSFSDIKSIELSQTASDKHEVPKDTRYVNAPLSDASNDKEGLQSVSSSSATKEEKSFTFEVIASAGPGQTGIQNRSLSKNTKVSSVSSHASLLDPNKLHEDSLFSQQTPSSAAIEAGSNGNSERKPRRKSAGKETAKKGNNLKETTPRRRSGRVEKSPGVLNPPAIGHVTSVEGLKPSESVECSNQRPGDIPPILTSNLPDLNNSTSMFQQSFTDTQQVQLRAQILVYGSLISGMAPEESHMIAAFGQSDGGRRAWEAAWHACLERVRGRKSQANNPDTPMQPRSDVGNRDPDQGIKVGSAQNKVLSPLTPRPSNMGISSTVVSPMIPISSPLWNISTPCDGLQSSVMPRSALLDYRPTLSPLHPYQPPRVQNFAGHNPSWLSQSPFIGQWVASSPVTAFGARFSSLPITDAVKLTTVKESGAPGVSVIPVDHTAGPSVSSGLSSLSNKKKAMVSSGQPSSDSKSRKRKKVAASGVVSEMPVSSQAQVASLCTPVAHLPWAPQTEGYNQISFLAQNQTISGTALAVSSHSPTSAALLTPVSVASKSNPGSSLSAVSPASTHGHPTRSDQNVEKIVTREEIVSKIEESKLQAADAAAHAAAVVSHCQSVWSQLEKQKSSGLVSDDEAKLASSAVSIAAAASVAKVAAAAAKIASNVAEQARLMADEVFLSSRTEKYDQSSMIANVDPNFDKGTPASVWKSANRSDHPTSIISAAREGARRRIEAASAASKHAENLDAIVKAAELAAEAVSQAGKIVAMGNPLPVKELVEAGPEGYWKSPQPSNQHGYSDKQNVEAAASDKDIQNLKHGLSLQEGSRDMAKNQMVIDGISTTSYENDRPQKGSDFSKTGEAFPEPEFVSIHTSDVDQNMLQSTSGTWEENGINEGCLVEVYKDDNKNKGAWFAANVLTLKDGKAFVCYTEVQSDEGQLKEWVALEVESTEAPRIRIAHPMTKMQFERTRKRSRKAFSDYAWCSGDRVDVWVQDSWREAVVLETNKIDVTSINVQFPAEGGTSIVKSWHVRPTLIWKDGNWIEWAGSKTCHSAEGDTPQEKRLKVGKPVVEGQEKDESSNNVDLIESEKHQQSRILPLSGQGSSFDVGKSSKDENKFETTRRTMRGGLQKERPRVVFGVPKPGKKQKFMDVSKHYVAEGSNKSNPPNDSVMLASSLMPQAPGPSGSRNNSKNDAKEKQVAEIKSKVLKSRKPPIPSIRTLAQKDKSKSSKPTSRDAVLSSKTIKDSVNVDENVSPKAKYVIEDSSASALPSDPPKGTLTSKAITQRLNKGKVAAGGSKATKVEVKEKSTSESEPRRSNRRIQPTSRLLEGLQSSLSVSKTPTGSHASQKSHNKVMSKGNG
ncbi:uncharacterized protein LOC112529161 isoform X2 [Cynara cardunculus var. scolymus]|uniref:uncharacterized protein LOC112529161 isoform X2 n=1 Tax=Cynara cardunculus var. scolymus TaxID=59895 RepID=UPI000D62E62C|nr:uncharacterized protein LOC112529161 isoform X2 [Cynara cardunculus var. scolymus]